MSEMDARRERIAAIMAEFDGEKLIRESLASLDRTAISLQETSRMLSEILDYHQNQAENKLHEEMLLPQ